MNYCLRCKRFFEEPREVHVVYGDGQYDIDALCPLCDSYEWVPEKYRKDVGNDIQRESQYR